MTQIVGLESVTYGSLSLSTLFPRPYYTKTVIRSGRGFHVSSWDAVVDGQAMPVKGERIF